MKQFNVLCWDFNSDSLVPYDVLPYFRDRYKEQVKQAKKYPKNDYWKVPTTREELKEFIEKKSMYQFWARCEYEMICHGWPVQKNEHKLDVHEQIMMNIDTITDILFTELNNKNYE